MVQLRLKPGTSQLKDKCCNHFSITLVTPHFNKALLLSDRTQLNLEMKFHNHIYKLEINERCNKPLHHNLLVQLLLAIMLDEKQKTYNEHVNLTAKLGQG